jgi:hypothetical protein
MFPPLQFRISFPPDVLNINISIYGTTVLPVVLLECQTHLCDLGRVQSYYPKSVWQKLL